MNPKKEIKQIELIIDNQDVMIKQYVAGIWSDSSQFEGFQFNTSMNLDAAECYGPGNQKYESLLHSNHMIDVKFPEPIQPSQKYSYKLNMLLKPSEHLQKLGTLNILEWPKEDLTEITFLRNAGSIFFSSALAQISINSKNHTRSIIPGNYAHGLTSHARNASAIRVEWGKPPRYQLQFLYRIENLDTNPISNFELTSYIPSLTKFQKSKVYSSKGAQILEDKDENWLFIKNMPDLAPRTVEKVQFQLDIDPIGNKSVLLPHFGNWKDYHALTMKGTVGEGLIQVSKYWPTKDPLIQNLVNTLKKNSKNASKFIKLAFEFVNQKITYKINNRRADALETLSSRSGDCSEMSDLLVCILRAGGIPAKIVHGWTIDLHTHHLNPHAWCEIFSPRANGWRQCDPTWGFLTGVSCQHLCRQREGLIPDQDTYHWKYNGDGKVEVIEQITLQVIN